MKNTHIQNLDNEIPTPLRLEVYKETLTHFEQNRWDSNILGERLWRWAMPSASMHYVGAL